MLIRSGALRMIEVAQKWPKKPLSVLRFLQTAIAAAEARRLRLLGRFL
jgi:hypothetical protein